MQNLGNTTYFITLSQQKNNRSKYSTEKTEQ